LNDLEVDDPPALNIEHAVIVRKSVSLMVPAVMYADDS
jgi:hypothetical protein